MAFNFCSNPLRFIEERNNQLPRNRSSSCSVGNVAKRKVILWDLLLWETPHNFHIPLGANFLACPVLFHHQQRMHRLFHCRDYNANNDRCLFRNFYCLILIIILIPLCAVCLSQNLILILSSCRTTSTTIFLYCGKSSRSAGANTKRFTNYYGTRALGGWVVVVCRAVPF